jgi:hypothetical protein
MEDQNSPATKADITAVKAEVGQLRSDVKQDIGLLGSEVKQDIEQLRSEVNRGYNDLAERMADTETRLSEGILRFRPKQPAARDRARRKLGSDPRPARHHRGQAASSRKAA